MESKWEKILLKDICDYKTGRLNSNAAEDDGVYPFFTCSPEVFKISTYAFDQDAVILGGNNANGKFPLKRYEGKFNAYQRTYVMASKNNDIIDNTYLYYYLLYKLNYLKNLSIGSATKFLTKTILDRLEINYPKDNHQMKLIGQILAKIDSKISLNQDIISNLEHLSQTLFKHWFINFEFPNELGQPYKSSGDEMVESELGEIPIIFNTGTIKDFCELKYGKALTKKNRIPGSYPVYGSGGITGTHKEYLIKGPGLIIGRKGSIGTLYLEANNFYPIDTVYYVESKTYPINFLHQFFKQYDFTQANNDSAVPGLNREFVYNTKAIIPDPVLVRKFEKILNPMYEKINNLLKENQQLSELRDTLLPKLLSGEIEISDELVVD
ncbi:type I restriction enzyme S subunit [Bacillus sp. RC242]|uniref:restriction endonuclease subunit S n=1 Tax=Bacillus sp. RC242 TaxID=3156286 RepID=UPI0038346538